MIGGQGQLV